VEEGLDRPALFLQLRIPGLQHHGAAAPFVRRHDGRDARLLADDAAQKHLEIDVAARRRYGHGWCNPFAVADDGEGLAFAACGSRRGGR
jgi:hypothetical protein